MISHKSNACCVLFLRVLNFVCVCVCVQVRVCSLYTVRLTHGDFTWTIKRKYKHFHDLHRDLYKHKMMLQFLPLGRWEYTNTHTHTHADINIKHFQSLKLLAGFLFLSMMQADANVVKRNRFWRNLVHMHRRRLFEVQSSPKALTRDSVARLDSRSPHPDLRKHIPVHNRNTRSGHRVTGNINK